MNNINVLWIFVGSLSFVLMVLSLRELIILARLPRNHPERGLYWFNTIFLLIATAVTISAGYYLDAERRALEHIIPIPASTHYAIERNKLIHDAMWVYTSDATEETIREFYHAYANTNHISYLEDEMRMSFKLPSGNLFLTLTTEGDTTVLYFSRDGEIRTIIREEVK